MQMLRVVGMRVRSFTAAATHRKGVHVSVARRTQTTRRMQSAGVTECRASVADAIGVARTAERSAVRTANGFEDQLNSIGSSGLDLGHRGPGPNDVR